MPTSPLLLATETRTITCSLYEGTGDVYTSIPGGLFNMQQEQWYPDEQVYTCPRCKGNGELEGTFCLVCTENVEVCSCTDEEIDAFLLTSYLGAA